MKDLLIDFLMKIIKQNCNYSDIKLKEIRYGLASLYLQLSKLIIICLISYLMGNLKTLLIFFTLYTILRTTGYGVHAKKSWHCWATSLGIFNILPFVIEKVFISKNIMIIVSVICIILLIIYAPADTEKRPLYNKKKRIICKIITVIETILYLFIMIKTYNNIFKRALLFAIILETILVLPITYKIFGVKNKNYKKGGKLK